MIQNFYINCSKNKAKILLTFSDMTLLQKLKHKNASLSVVGLGYVGLPVALAFARKVKVIGFDVSEAKVSLLRRSRPKTARSWPARIFPADLGPIFLRRWRKV